jgi:hypothetical protein
MTRCPVCGRDVPQDRESGSPRVYCDNNGRCKRAAARKRNYQANYKSLGLFVPGIMKKTKEHKREWGYT